MMTVKKEIIRSQRDYLRRAKTLDDVINSNVSEMVKVVKYYQLGYITAGDCLKMKQEILNGIEKAETKHSILSNFNLRF